MCIAENSVEALVTVFEDITVGVTRDIMTCETGMIPIIIIAREIIG
jgi:hypothetical protein